MTGLVVLLGHGIGYSASPALHNAGFRAAGIDACYQLVDVSTERLGDAVDALRAAERLGANVTRPHKLAVCELVDELDAAVRRLGAANTLVPRDGRLVAHNTDLPALAAELRELAELAERRGFARALVLGAGGASRAAVAALHDAGVETRVVDRAGWPELARATRAADLLVNATPVGTASDESPVPAVLLRASLTVLDLVYRPSPTRLVREARAAGAVARGGAGMLLRQAALSFRLWTGVDAPLEAMRGALRAELGVTADV